MKFTLTNESVTLIDGGKTHTVRKDAVNYKPLVAALLAEDFDTARNYLTTAKTVETWARGRFKIEGETVKCGDEVLPKTLADRIFKMIKANEDPQPLLNFWERLTKNPSWRSVNQLFNFLANSGIPIDQDGFILAYKAVNNNYTDCHTSKIDNSVGTVHEMERRLISDDDNTPCHFGFHVGALAYAESFGPANRRMIICKVDPADVVCVPKDASFQKVRCCKYEVIGLHNGAKMSDTTTDTKKDPAVAASKEAAQKKPEAKGTRAEAHPFDSMDSLTLMSQNLGELRTYAAVNLKIIGASKLPGGKVALVARIEEVRG